MSTSNSYASDTACSLACNTQYMGFWLDTCCIHVADSRSVFIAHGEKEVLGSVCDLPTGFPDSPQAVACWNWYCIVTAGIFSFALSTFWEFKVTMKLLLKIWWSWYCNIVKRPGNLLPSYESDGWLPISRPNPHLGWELNSNQLYKRKKKKRLSIRKSSYGLVAEGNLGKRPQLYPGNHRWLLRWSTNYRWFHRSSDGEWEAKKGIKALKISQPCLTHTESQMVWT